MTAWQERRHGRIQKELRNLLARFLVAFRFGHIDPEAYTIVSLFLRLAGIYLSEESDLLFAFLQSKQLNQKFLHKLSYPFISAASSMGRVVGPPPYGGYVDAVASASPLIIIAEKR